MVTRLCVVAAVCVLVLGDSVIASARKGPPSTRAEAMESCRQELHGDRTCYATIELGEKLFREGEWHPKDGPIRITGYSAKIDCGDSWFRSRYHGPCSYLSNIDKDPDFQAMLAAEAEQKRNAKTARDDACKRRLATREELMTSIRSDLGFKDSGGMEWWVAKVEDAYVHDEQHEMKGLMKKCSTTTEGTDGLRRSACSYLSALWCEPRIAHRKECRDLPKSNWNDDEKEFARWEKECKEAALKFVDQLITEYKSSRDRLAHGTERYELGAMTRLEYQRRDTFRETDTLYPDGWVARGGGTEKENAVRGGDHRASPALLQLLSPYVEEVGRQAASLSWRTAPDTIHQVENQVMAVASELEAVDELGAPSREIFQMGQVLKEAERKIDYIGQRDSKIAQLRRQLCFGYPEELAVLREDEQRMKRIDKSSGTRNLHEARRIATEREDIKEVRKLNLRELSSLGASFNKARDCKSVTPK